MRRFRTRVEARAGQAWHQLWVALVRAGFPPETAKRLTFEEAAAFLYEASRQVRAATQGTGTEGED